MCERKKVVMMRFTLIFLILLSFSSLKADDLKIKVVGNGWGKASKTDLKKVLESAANTIWRHCKEAKLPPIQVSKGNETPISLFQRAKNGDLQVKLTSKDTFWAQHSYQFAHEICHCLCRFKDGDKTNMWFEESLCETASLFALRAMSKDWQTKPPYPNWKSYSRALYDYAEKLLQDPERSLPENMTIKQWYLKNKESLEKDAINRKLNAVVAKEILKFLEKDPHHWEAVFWINEKRTTEKVSFEVYLRNWKTSVPEKHKKFVDEIIKLFGFADQ